MNTASGSNMEVSCINCQHSMHNNWNGTLCNRDDCLDYSKFIPVGVYSPKPSREISSTASPHVTEEGK